MKTALSAAIVLIMFGAGGAVAQTVATTEPPHDAMTADIFKALGCTVSEAAEPDRCARR